MVTRRSASRAKQRTDLWLSLFRAAVAARATYGLADQAQFERLPSRLPSRLATQPAFPSNLTDQALLTRLLFEFLLLLVKQLMGHISVHGVLSSDHRSMSSDQ